MSRGPGPCGPSAASALALSRPPCQDLSDRWMGVRNPDENSTSGSGSALQGGESCPQDQSRRPTEHSGCWASRGPVCCCGPSVHVCVLQKQGIPVGPRLHVPERSAQSGPWEGQGWAAGPEVRRRAPAHGLGHRPESGQVSGNERLILFWRCP